MKLMTLTSAWGTPSDINPMHLLGASPRIVTSLINGQEKPIFGTEVALVDGVRQVLQSPDEVRRLFQEAMEGVAINVIALQPAPPDDMPLVE